MKKLLFCAVFTIFFLFNADYYVCAVKSEISGNFTSNILSNSMENQSSQIVLGRLNRSLLSILNGNKLWIHYFSYYKQYEMENSDEIFKKRRNTAVFGADLSKSKDYLLGLFFEYSFEDLKQGGNTSLAYSYIGGFYALKEFLIDRQNINLKTDISLNFNNYEIERSYIKLPNTAFNLQNPFKSLILQTSLEADYLYNDSILLFTGLDFSFLTNRQWQENSSSMGALTIKNLSNTRIDGSLGFVKEAKYKKTDLDFKFYLNRALLGGQTKLEILFEDTQTTTQILSGEESLNIVLSAGLKYPFTDKFFIRYRNDLSFGYKSFGYGFLIEVNIELGKKNLKLEEIETKFQRSQEFFEKKEYLKASDLLSEILSVRKEHLPSLDLQNQIKKIIDENLVNISKTKIEDNIYAKGYKAYYADNFKSALSEWYRYMQYDKSNKEVTEYYNKVQSAVREKEEEQARHSDAAKAQKKAQEMLQDGVKKFENKLWSKCIKTMEKLLSFTVESKLENPQFYRQKAQYYISESLKQLVPASNKEQSAEENVIDEKGAEDSYREGLSLYSQGQYIEAQRAWELTLRLNPNHKKAAAAISNLKRSGQIKAEN